MKPDHRSVLLTALALVMVIAPATLALTKVALFFSGGVGLVIPPTAVALVFLYRLVVQSSESWEGSVLAREVGAGLIATAVGFGTFVGAIVVGVLAGVIPLFSDVGGYPYADAWCAGSLVLGILVIPVTWWLLRRFVDPGLRTSNARSQRM